VAVAVGVQMREGLVGVGLGQVGGKPWLKVDLTDPNNPIGAMFAKVSGNIGPG